MFESKPVRKILVPTDFSAASESALYYAALLAKAGNAKVILLHVNELPALISNEQALATDFQMLEKDILSNLHEQKARVENEYGILVDCQTQVGFTIPEIKDQVKKDKVDMVILGSKGAHGWKELFLGSISGKIIEHCDCPVLVLPEKASIKLPSRIAFATNYNHHEMRALFLLVELMKHLQPEIMILHVAESHDEKLEEKMMAWFKAQVQSTISYDHFSFHELHGSSVEQALEDFVKSAQIDLLASAKRKRHFFDRLTTKSLTKDLAHHLPVPLMVFQVEAHAGTPVF